MLKNKKILFIIIPLAIILLGILVLCIKGMNYGLMYGENTQIKVYLDSEIEDVSNLVTEVFGKNKIQKLNGVNTDILITVKEASEEQLDSFVTKVNENNGIELTRDDLEVSNNAKIKGIDLISPYVLPSVITSVLVLIYFVIRYKKFGILKITIYTLTVLIGAQLLYLSIYAVARIPVNYWSMPISIIIYVLSIIGLSEFFEKNK